jgi:hypothetical protein
VRVVQSGAVVREAEVASPGWVYSASEIAADGLSGAAEISVAQISDIYGAGAPRVLGVAF